MIDASKSGACGQMVHIDLGWYPDGDPDGSYRLVAILNDDWENPPVQFGQYNY